MGNLGGLQRQAQAWRGKGNTIFLVLVGLGWVGIAGAVSCGEVGGCYSVVDVGHDGNCLFHAVADQLNKRNIGGVGHTDKTVGCARRVRQRGQDYEMIVIRLRVCGRVIVSSFTY